MLSVNPRSKYLPTPTLEWWYYAQVFYAIMGTALGLSVGSLGAAGLALLAAVCLIRAGKYRTVIIQAAVLPLACGLSFVAVQTFVHSESILGSTGNRSFITWMFGLVIVHYLALRPGFLHRFAVVAAVIGLATLPYLVSVGGDASRARLDKTITINNPNDLGAWFGFVCVYFAILGLETRRNSIRALSWIVAGGCVLVIGLTVSRTPIFAAACGVAFAFRRVLKRGFVPFVAFIVVAWLAYAFGFFDSTATRFAQRGLVDSGRLSVWPLAIQRILESPLSGVGVQHVATYLPLAGVSTMPHNSFIFLALSSGVIPLLFFAVYWAQLFATTLRGSATSNGERSFESSLLVYSFLIAMSLGAAFQFPWMVATLAAVRVSTLASRARPLARAPIVGSRVIRLRRGSDAWSHSHQASSRGHRPVIQ